MFRVVALVAGALAGFVASLILALGGLEVTASAFGGLGERQLALARFGLIFIANLSLLGAGVTLALPRAGAILLFLAGAAWAGAAVYLGHSTDMVLFGPPTLALLGVVFALIASFRTPREAAAVETAEPAIDRFVPPDPYDVAPGAVRVPKTALGPAPVGVRAPLDGLSERDFIPGRLNGRDERQAAPRPTETPTFRSLDPEDDEEEEFEPSFARRLGGGIASLLSFGLYAAAAAAVLLVLWNVYQRDKAQPTVAEVSPAPSSSAAQVAAVTSSSQPPPAAPAPVIVVTPPPQPSTAPSSAPAASSAAVVAPSAPPPAPSVAASSSEPIRLVGEPPPSDAVAVSSAPPPPSVAPETAPSSSEPPPSAVAEVEPGPTPDFVDTTKTAPTPAIMSPELAAARRSGAFANVQPDSFTIAPSLAGSDI